MDVFLFPSLFEGLPFTLLEAQANGLPCVISDQITGEAVLSREKCDNDFSGRKPGEMGQSCV